MSDDVTALVRRLLTAVVVLLTSATALGAQAPARTPNTIQYPQSMAPRSTKKTLGFSLAAMPAAIVQEAASIRWPMVNFDIAMGLPKNFLLVGAVNTQLVTNHLEAGAHWVAHVSDRFHAEAGMGGAFWFGRLKRFGFDNTINGTFLYPSASAGYDFGTMALTVQAKASIIGSLTAHSGSLTGETSRNVFNGVSYRVSLEQPFRKGQTVGLAFQMNYLRFYYPQWPLFPTFDHHFWIPEAQIRVSL